MARAWLLVLALCCAVDAYVRTSTRMRKPETNHFEWRCYYGGFCTDFKTTFHFSYNSSSPRSPLRWFTFAPCCGGDLQSPINIPVSHASKYCFPPLRLNDSGEITGTLENKELVMQLSWGDLEEDKPVTLHGVPHNENDTYELVNVHFHWGDSKASEHFLDGHRFDAEMHIVFYNRKFEDEIEARAVPDGLAVVAVFLEEDSGTKSDAVEELLEKGAELIEPGAKRSAKINPRELLPQSRKYATYRGSLTSPPCAEIVRWVVMLQPLKVSQDLLDGVRKLKNKEGDRIAKFSNARRLQRFDNRAVETNTDCTNICPR